MFRGVHIIISSFCFSSITIYSASTPTHNGTLHTQLISNELRVQDDFFLHFYTSFFLQMRKRGKVLFVLLFIVENSIFSWKSFSDRCWGCFNMFYLFKRALLISIFLCSTHKRVPARGYSTYSAKTSRKFIVGWLSRTEIYIIRIIIYRWISKSCHFEIYRFLHPDSDLVLLSTDFQQKRVHFARSLYLLLRV